MSNLSNESSNKKKSSLGRGLGSLLGEPGTGGAAATAPKASVLDKPASATTVTSAPAPAPQVPPESRVWQVGIDKLRPSAFQPRSLFDKAKLEELSQSIKTSGILQPIVARKLANGSFEIIAGERRWRAAQLAGLHEVPVLLKSFGDRETLELALIENIQREDLNAIEEAEAYQRLAQEFHLTQQQVAEKVGKDRATVANAIRLLQLSLDVREMISNQEITVGHAKVLLALPQGPEQLKWAKKVRDQNLTVRQLEKSVQEVLVPLKKEANTDSAEANRSQKLIAGLAEELQRLFGTKVTLDYANAKGKISVHYYSDDELNEIVEKMRDGCRKS